MTPPATNSTPDKPKVQHDTRQLKLMGALSLMFLGGILLYAFVPEGSLRGTGMGLYSVLMLVILFRYCI
jgi:hypothetical protein